MSRIKHPVRAIREPFGTAGLIVACIALIAAVGGTAWAAAKLNSTQKKEVEKIAKKFAGKPGANGAPGAQGPAGAAGANGKEGPEGKAGESVTISAASNAECIAGGSKFTNGTGTGKACNGKEGEEGPPGPPGPQGPLQSGKTETGTWTISLGPEGLPAAPVSFTLPLSTTLDSSHVHYVGETGNGTTCLGSAAEPKAESGNLCVYLEFNQGIEPGGTILNPGSSLFSPVIGAGKTGAVIVLSRQGSESPFAYGTWAVTG